MAHLKVRLRGKITHELHLDPSKSYIVGRKAECDIVLQPEKGISREHFKIFCENEIWSVEVTSKYGDVVLSGEKTQGFKLEQDILFSVPPYEFEFSVNDIQESEVQQNEMSVEQAPAFNQNELVEVDMSEKTRVGVVQYIPYVKVLDANGETKEIFRLEGGNTWIAGRESTCHIQIRDQRVSRKQFEIRNLNNQYYIVDLGSVNGTLLNGSPVAVSEPTTLVSGDSIGVLNNLMVFELHDPQFKNKLEIVNAQAYFPTSQPLQAYEPTAPVSVNPYESHPYSMPMPHQPMQPAPPQTLIEKIKTFDFKKHSIKIIIGIIVLAAIYMSTSSDTGNTKKTDTTKNQNVDPLSKLKPEQQLLVKQSYELADSLFKQGKYELARNEVNKVTEFVTDYKDLRQLDRAIKDSIALLEERRRQDQLEKDKADAEEKIIKKVNECGQKVSRMTSPNQLDECLSDVMQFNPDHPKILELKAVLNKIVSDLDNKRAQQVAHASDVSRLKSLYSRATDLQKSGKVLEAIKAYQVVISTRLPDPYGLKKISEANINNLRKAMNSKTATLQTEAEAAAKNNNYKVAILALRKARLLDPQNELIQDKIDRYMVDLKKQMMVLYQEGILEESFGNVEGGMGKAGAKEKWKMILEQDVTDGEYYKKAYLKLKKYGAF